MTFLLSLPAVLSALALAAHFVHQGSLPMAALSVAVLIVLAIRDRLAVLFFQVFLVIGAAEWGLTILRLIDDYAEKGRPTKRMIIILACVAGWNLLSAVLLWWRPTSRDTPGTTDSAGK